MSLLIWRLEASIDQQPRSVAGERRQATRASDDLKSDECDGKDLGFGDFWSNVGEFTMILDLRDENIEKLKAGRPLVRWKSRRWVSSSRPLEKKLWGRERVRKEGLANGRSHRAPPYEGGI